jgi:hypothetical protein
MHNPETRELEGLRLAGPSYWPIQPDEKGRLWSEQFGVFLGVGHSVEEGRNGNGVRLYLPASLLPAKDERIEAELRRAEEEAELARFLVGPG